MHNPHILVLEPKFFSFKEVNAQYYQQALSIVLDTFQKIYPYDVFEVNTYYYPERQTQGLFRDPDAPPRDYSIGSFAHTTLTVIDSDAFEKAGFVETVIECKTQKDGLVNSPQKFYMEAKGTAPEQLYFESQCFEPKAYFTIFSELKTHFKKWKSLKKYWANHQLRPNVF